MFVFDWKNVYLLWFLNSITKRNAIYENCKVYYCTWPYSVTHTLSRAPLDEGSVRSVAFYQTTYNIHKKGQPCPPAGFKSAIPASERSRTYALDHVAIEIRFSPPAQFLVARLQNCEKRLLTSSCLSVCIQQLGVPLDGF